MKKLIFLVIAFMIVASTVSFAEDVDFSEMTTEELIALSKEIDIEISNRMGESLPNENSLYLPEGYYVVGKDIAVGSYGIEDVSSTDSVYESDSGWRIYIFPSEERLKEYNDALKEYDVAYREASASQDEAATYPDEVSISDYTSESQTLGENDICHITLEDGEVIQIERVFSEGELIITKSTGLFMD